MRLPSHAWLAGEATPPFTEAQEGLGQTVISRQTHHYTMSKFRRCCLKLAIVVMIDALEDWEKPIKVGMISSQDHQYSKNAVDHQWPCTITMKGSTPMSNRCVVPQILKLWPDRVPRPLAIQTSLHL